MLLLSGCGIYTSYEPQTSVPEELYGEEVNVSDTVSIGNIHWKDFFSDPYLQALIEKDWRRTPMCRLPVCG